MFIKKSEPSNACNNEMIQILKQMPNWFDPVWLARQRQGYSDVNAGGYMVEQRRNGATHITPFWKRSMGAYRSLKVPDEVQSEALYAFLYPCHSESYQKIAVVCVRARPACPERHWKQRYTCTTYDHPVTMHKQFL